MKSGTKIAIIQEGPVYLDLEKSLEKVKVLSEKAAAQGARLVVFGECWLSGYPIWLDCCSNVNIWNSEPVKNVWASTYQNSIDIKSKTFKKLLSISKELSINMIIGANEKITEGKGNNTIYNSLFIIDAKGKVKNHHRKLIPTYTERLVHGNGDGNGLSAVNLDFARVGSLICWEHWMPLTRQAMHDSGEEIHFALWPQVKPLNGLASQHYAIEGRCYVIAVGQVMQASELPKELEHPFKEEPSTYLMNGGSCVYGPDGTEIIPPQGPDVEIVYFNLPDGQTLIKETMNLAVSGHYQRPDVFNFQVNKERTFK